MLNRHALAGKAGALLFENVERRLETLLAEHGAADPSELPRALQATYFGGPLSTQRRRTSPLSIFMRWSTAPVLLCIRRLWSAVLTVTCHSRCRCFA
jgi:hypothetical protein